MGITNRDRLGLLHFDLVSGFAIFHAFAIQISMSSNFANFSIYNVCHAVTLSSSYYGYNVIGITCAIVV